jgi:hypothetical protein
VEIALSKLNELEYVHCTHIRNPMYGKKKFSVLFCKTPLGNISLKEHGNEKDFLGFLQKLVPHESPAPPFRSFRFWLRICGDIRIRKTTPRYHLYGESPTLPIGDTGSRRLRVSVMRGVVDSPTQRYRESSTPRITDTESQLLNFFKRKLSVSMIRRVDDSVYR